MLAAAVLMSLYVSSWVSTGEFLTSVCFFIALFGGAQLFRRDDTDPAAVVANHR